MMNANALAENLIKQTNQNQLQWATDDIDYNTGYITVRDEKYIKIDLLNEWLTVGTFTEHGRTVIDRLYPDKEVFSRLTTTAHQQISTRQNQRRQQQLDDIFNTFMWE